MRRYAGHLKRAVVVVSRTPAFAIILSTLLTLAGLLFLVYSGYQTFSPRKAYGVVSIDLSFANDNYDVNVYLLEVGKKVNPDYYKASSAWSECREGVAYSVAVDQNGVYGPYCMSGLTSFFEKLLSSGRLNSHFTVILPPGSHHFKILVMKDGKLWHVSTFDYVVPTPDEVKLCGGVWPCTEAQKSS